jgi:hypothetical protein
MGKFIKGGYLPPDDPAFRQGPQIYSPRTAMSREARNELIAAKRVCDAVIAVVNDTPTGATMFALSCRWFARLHARGLGPDRDAASRLARPPVADSVVRL